MLVPDLDWPADLFADKKEPETPVPLWLAMQRQWLRPNLEVDFRRLAA